MSEILAIGLSSMQNDMQRMEHIAMNLANTLTPGYKRQVAVSQPFAGVLEHMQARSADQSEQAAPLRLPEVTGRTLIDVRPGALKSTGQSLDLAIEGEGYFEVATAAGPAYTRQGNFHLDERGRLVTAQGLPVMGRNGEIVLDGAKAAIDHAGNIFSGQAGNPDSAVAQFKLVKFDDATPMGSLGNGLLTPGAGMTQLDAGAIRLRQGFLEGSNVSTQQEMIQLMQTTRHFESVQKAVQGYDELLGTAIHKLGDV